MNKKVAVIGGGLAGMEASAYLAAMGYEVTIFEKSDKTGGHLLNWKHLFPTRRPGEEVISFLMEGLKDPKIKILLNSEIIKAENTGKSFRLLTNKGDVEEADAVLIATGYDLFDARKKEEYGYGIYDNVITSAELEAMLANEKGIRTASGNIPKRIGIIHCVGSRDEKIGNIYCSRVCCITGVKQSLEIKEHLKEADVTCFYMDLRMFGKKFEDLYLESQQKWGVNFIRGRLSEVFENKDGSVLLKVEDTLIGKPLKMSVDLLILLIGMTPSQGTKETGKMLNLEFDNDGFLKCSDEHTSANISGINGIFLAGTCKGPGTVIDTINDARAAALRISGYLEHYQVIEREDFHKPMLKLFQGK